MPYRGTSCLHKFLLVILVIWKNLYELIGLKGCVPVKGMKKYCGCFKGMYRRKSLRARLDSSVSSINLYLGNVLDKTTTRFGVRF